jgi:hypothetical protein
MQRMTLVGRLEKAKNHHFCKSSEHYKEAK